MSNFSVIVAAAGSGTRFQSGNQKKTYAVLAGKPLWLHSVERFANRDDVTQILIVVSPDDLDWFKDCLLYTSPSPRDGLLSRMPSSA